MDTGNGTKEEVKLYKVGRRNIMALDRKFNNIYCKHVSAMTREGLYEKSDIAAELAWRDAIILALQCSHESCLYEEDEEALNECRELKA